MIDIPIITPAGLNIQAQPLGQAGLVNYLPPSIAGLPLGSLVTATVLRQDASGNFLLGSNLGQFAVSGRLLLQEGSKVVLEVVSAGAVNVAITTNTNNSSAQQQAIQARLLTVDGRPAKEFYGNIDGDGKLASANNLSTQASGSQRSEEAFIFRIIPQISKHGNTAANIQQPAQQADSVDILRGKLVNTILVNPSEDSDQFINTRNDAINQQNISNKNVQISENLSSEYNQIKLLPQLKPSDILLVKLLNIIPTQDGNNQQASSLPVQVSKITQGLNQNFDSQKAILTSPPEGKSVPISSVLSDKPVVIPQESKFSGVVIGKELNEYVVKTNLGTLKVDLQHPVPKGSVINFELLSVNHSVRAEAITPGEKVARAIISSQNSLGQVIQTLRTVDPENADKMIRNFLPAPDKTFAPRLFNYINGVISGDASFMLNNDVRRILEQQRRHDLIKKIDNEFNSYKQLASDSGTGWNALSFPVFDGKTLNYGVFYFRDYNDKDNQDQKVNRFIVDVELSELGAFQFDGYVREVYKKKDLDLHIKTKNKLPDSMITDIIDIFTESTELLGINGYIHFLVQDDFSISKLGKDSDNDSILV